MVLGQTDPAKINALRNKNKKLQYLKSHIQLHIPIWFESKRAVVDWSSIKLLALQ